MDKTAKPPRALLRKKRWLWLFLPLLLWVFCEVYDHVPKRSWFYRQTHTIALIDVTAKLEIDGQPLTLTRTLRCIRQPPVRGLARNWAAPDSMTVFDAVGGVTSTGRTFILNVPKACEAIFFNDKNEAFATMLNNEHLAGAPRAHGPLEPVSYSGGDLVAPVIYEPVGENPPDKIIAYLAAPELFTTGNHGVKFVDLTIAHSKQSILLFDRSVFENLGMTGNRVAIDEMFSGRVATELPEPYWQLSDLLSEGIRHCESPCFINLDSHQVSATIPSKTIISSYDYGYSGDISRSRKRPFEDEGFNVFHSETYSLEYVDGVFTFSRNNKGLIIYQRLPKNVVLSATATYSFDGDAQVITENNCFYLSRDGRVLSLSLPLNFSVWR